jgi:hypothetical protein
MFRLGLRQDRVTGCPRPTKRFAASRRKVVSRSLPATLDRYPHGSAGHVAIPNRSIRACEPLSAPRKSRFPKDIELQHLWRQPAEDSRGERGIDDAIEKMLERDHPASAAPNRFLGVGRAVS